MRFTSTLAILSVAALASAHVLRNVATDLCLDVDGVMEPFTPLIMTFCDNLRHGDWSIEVVGEKSALLKNTETFRGRDMCVQFVAGEEENADHAPLNRVENTSRKRWSFSTVVDGEELALSAQYPGISRARFLPVKGLQDDISRYEWSKKLEGTMYKKLYSWMRFQGR
ncbi:hypothetical protein BGZ72_004816 [Mortierella alpina]|nr:hypothetical protein BGZ72_004816 [Mortierella alpina]